MHTVRVDLTSDKGKSGKQSTATSRLSTEKSAMQLSSEAKAGTSRSVLNLLTFYNSKQSASSGRPELGVFCTPVAADSQKSQIELLQQSKQQRVGPTAKSSKKGTKKGDPAGKPVQKQGQVVKSFDAGVPLKQ